MLFAWLWEHFIPDMPIHALIVNSFPRFVGASNFCLGLIWSAVLGWFVAMIFVFSYNLWVKVVDALWRKKPA